VHLWVHIVKIQLAYRQIHALMHFRAIHHDDICMNVTVPMPPPATPSLLQHLSGASLGESTMNDGGQVAAG